MSETKRAPLKKVRQQDEKTWLATASPQARNTLRAVLLFLDSGRPARELQAFVAQATNAKLKTVYDRLCALESLGFIRIARRAPRPPHFVCVAAPYSRDGLKHIIGEDMEATPTRVVTRCPQCTKPLRPEEICQACAAQDAIPWLSERLDYYAARVRRGLPLFDPPPPWARDGIDNMSDSSN